MKPDGDAEGFEEFFRAVEPTLRRAAFLYTGNPEQAHDLVQETLVRAWQHWPRVSRHPHPDAWCRTVLRNLATSRWRRTRLEQSRRTDRTGTSRGPSADHLDVVAALRRLPASQLQAIILHDVMGYTAEEVAEELRTSPGTVRSWLSRARQTLSHDLADRLPEKAKGGTA
ncbi:MAG TPA: SigE family RNA polymerase sigma factor [Acidimicrobiales bacterium]|nr:SigE family RNA polymerase sigma factor [Acidimicrobiales bacterium]